MNPRIPRPSLPAPLVDLEAVQDDELLAGLLAIVTKDDDPLGHARLLIEEAGGLAALARESPLELVCRHALRPRTARLLASSLEIGLRCAERQARVSRQVRCSADIARLAGPRLRHLDHEQLWLLALDGGTNSLGLRRLGQGGRHGCSVLVRDVLRAAVSLGAGSFALVHNHPSGDPTPSPQDLNLTRKLALAADCIGVPLVDHVIVTDNDHVSLLDVGFLRSVLDEDAATAI